MDELGKLDKALLLMQVFAAGIEVEYDKNRWKLAANEEDKYNLCAVAEDTNGNEVLLNTLCSLTAFIEMADQISSDQLFLLTGNVILNQQSEGMRMS